MGHPLVRSYVTKVELQTDTMVLSVQLEGFEKGETVYLTGSVTQQGPQADATAFALINSTQPITDTDFEGIAQLTADLPAKGFNPGEDLTIVLWASKVWLTVLQEDPAATKQGLAAWKVKSTAAPW